MKRMTLCPIVIAFGLVLTIAAPAIAQQASQNIPVLPVISEDDDPLWYLKGDGYLQRQVEPTIAVSTRNPDHLLSFFVDYRAVDIGDDVGLGEETQTWTAAMAATSLLLNGLISLPDIPHLESPPIAAAEAWVGGSRSYDGGLTWSGFFIPGAPANFYPPDSGILPSLETEQLPIYGLEAATDPVAIAGPCGYVYVAFLAFTRGDESKMVVARFQDLNDIEGGDTWVFQGMTVLESGNNATNGYFLDKPAIALDIFREDSDFSAYASNFSDYECGHRVYVSYSTFNGLESDGKFRSKINFSSSVDAGQTWTKAKIQQPYNQNQGSALAVDPTDGTVYLVWRHFFNPDTVLMVKTSNFGKKWSKPVDLTEGDPMYPYDQPTIATTSIHPDPDLTTYPYDDLTFRSNSFPTAVVAANGAGGSTLFVAWQEFVSLAAQDFGFPSPAGSPRIVLTRSDNGGATWTGPGKDPADGVGFWERRRAVDFADRDQPNDFWGVYHQDDAIPEPGFGALPDDRPSGPQVMPWLSAGGGKLALAYHESRGLLGGVPGADIPGSDYDKRNVGIEPVGLSGWGFISGLYRAVDFRVALLDTVTGRATSTAQVSRYPIDVTADISDGERVEDVAPVVPLLCEQFPESLYCMPSLDFKNKPQSASGSAAFQGDYVGMTPISQFVFDGSAWKWATSASDVPYSGFHVVFADNRNLVPATYTETGSEPEELRYQYYLEPNDCVNVGSRNTDVLTAHVNTDLIVSAPTTYKSLENPVNSFPFSIRNSTDEPRTFGLALSGDTEHASFSYAVDDPAAQDTGTVYIYPFSSVSLVVYVSSSAEGPVYVNITEDGGLGQSATLMLNAGFANLDNYTGEEVDNPFVQNPFVQNPFVQNPFVQNPFVRNSTSTNVSLSNPFVQNPFVQNPFVQNSSLADVEVIDTTWEVEPDAGSTTASTYFPIININNAAQFTGNYAFQLIVWKQSGFGGSVNECQTTGIFQDQVLSNVYQNPNDTTENPFVLNPSVENPFVQNPFVQNPFVQNPFVRNSAFTMAPADLEPNVDPQESTLKFATNGNDVTLPAKAARNGVNVTLRAYRLKKYCDEEGAVEGDCLQKPACRPGEDPVDDVCEEGVIECGPDQDPEIHHCVIPSFVYNPKKDPPSTSVGSDRCIMQEILKGEGGDVEGTCFKSPAADLIPYGVTEALPPGEVGKDLIFPGGWKVYNKGLGAATAENRDLRHGFYLSTDEVLDLDQKTGQLSNGDEFLNSVSSGGIGTTILGESYSAPLPNVPLPIPGDLPILPEGENYYIILYVDDLLEVSEKSEVNNFFQAVVPLTVVIPNDPPVVTLGDDFEADEGQLVQFFGTFTDPDIDHPVYPDSHTFEWDFGDGTDLVTTQDATHVFADEGIYTVTFTVTDSFGESDSDSVVVTVLNVPPVAYFTYGPFGPGEPVEGQEVPFDASGTTAPGAGDIIQSYEWDFGDGNTAITDEPVVTHIYANDGVYTVTLTATDNDGSSSQQSVEVTVYNVPPSTTGQSVTTPEDVPVGITLQANDPGSEVLTYTVSSPANGWLDGTPPNLIYHPNLNFSGTDSFSFFVNDGHVDSNTSVVEITVTPVKDYDFLGFQDPWTPPPPVYAAKVGSAIPLKWQWAQNGVVEESSGFSPQVWVRGPVDCTTLAENENTPEDRYLYYPGNSDYRYFSDTDTWQFNWDTDGKVKGCYNIYVYNAFVLELDAPGPVRLK